MFHLANYAGVLQDAMGGVDGGARLMPLAPDGPLRHEGVKLIEEASDEDLLDGEAVANKEFVDCVRSAALLYFSALDASHNISQGIASGTGSFLHGIMHRQEPDYSNAKYWFRRTGKHELFPTLREEAMRLPLREDSLRSAIQARPEWDSLWFVDLCEKAAGAGGSLEQDALEIQRLEWQLIFDYSYRRALAG